MTDLTEAHGGTETADSWSNGVSVAETRLDGLGAAVAGPGRGLAIEWGGSLRGRCPKASPDTDHMCVLPVGHDGPHWGVPLDRLRRSPNLAVKRMAGGCIGRAAS